MVKPEKIKNIEILRFLFILSIISCHLRDTLKLFFDSIPWYQILHGSFAQSHRPVDYFFIIAGFFLFMTTDFRQNFCDFAKNKLIRMMPLVIFSVFLFWVFSLFTPIQFPKFEFVFTLLSINCVGLTFKGSINAAAWFVSALFWSMCFYFYLYKITDKKWFNLICACLIFFCYSMYINTTGKMFLNVYSVFNKGILRAFAGIGVGYFISMIYKDNIESIKNWSLNIWQKLGFTVMEGFLLCWLLYYTFLHHFRYKNFLILILAFIGLFWLFLIKKGWISKLLDNNISVFLGQFTFSIFLTHLLVIILWKRCWCETHQSWVIVNPILNLFIVYTVSILFGVLTFYLFEKPITKYLKNKFCARIKA